MRYPASEKLEIIRLVDRSHLSAKQTPAKRGLPRTTFYRWFDKYPTNSADALADKAPLSAEGAWNTTCKCMISNDNEIVKIE